MILVMKPAASQSQINKIIEKLETLSFQVHRSTGVNYTILAALGPERELNLQSLTQMEGVERVFHTDKPYKLAARQFKPNGTVIEIGPVRIGDQTPVVVADVSHFKSLEQIEKTAKALMDCGIHMLRWGSSRVEENLRAQKQPNDLALRQISQIARIQNFVIVAAVSDHTELEFMGGHADIFQIGAHNMQNADLLRAVGRMGKPVLLERAVAAKMEDFLLAAEYVMSTGNYSVILCERGIRSFDDYAPLLFDVGLIPAIKALSHLPVLANPSYVVGRPDHLAAVALAGIAAGADGLVLPVAADSGEILRSNLPALGTKALKELLDRVRVLSRGLRRRPFHEASTV
ncbi:hypothetical protein HYR54_12020 [Candidatus Acetothermia bacterium]|nr:hypothetical protein [Candidatus Acetothermia bacterium]